MTDFMTEFCELMKDKKIKKFKEKYINDYSDVETVLLYSFLYENISKEYHIRYNDDIPDRLFKDIARYIFQNNKYRQQLIESFRKFQKENLQLGSSSSSLCNTPVFQLDM